MTEKKLYFAAMNTSEGFVGYFDKIFDPEKLEKIYIIKGGPGCGKSSIIKKVGEHFQNIGHDAEYFLCSSDPSSFDGVLIKDMKIGIIDGTSPHAFEAKYPGVVEEIVDTCSCLNIEKLKISKKSIIKLTNLKKKAYSNAYSFLNVAKKIGERIISFHESSFNYESADEKIQSLIPISKCEHGDGSIRIVNSFNLNGESHLDTFEKESESIISIPKFFFAENLFMKCLHDYIIKNKIKYVLSFSNIFPNIPQSVYIPKLKTLITTESVSGSNIKILDMKAFTDVTLINGNKNKIQFLMNCMEETKKLAQNELINASKIHAEIEKKYINSISFENVNKLTENLISNIEKRQ